LGGKENCYSAYGNVSNYMSKDNCTCIGEILSVLMILYFYFPKKYIPILTFIYTTHYDSNSATGINRNFWVLWHLFCFAGK